MINRTTLTKKQKWEEKQMYECFMLQTSEIALGHSKEGEILREKLSLF